MGTSELAQNILGALIGQGILQCNYNGFIEEDWLPIIENEISKWHEANNDSLDRDRD